MKHLDVYLQNSATLEKMMRLYRKNLRTSIVPSESFAVLTLNGRPSKLKVKFALEPRLGYSRFQLTDRGLVRYAD